MIKLNMKNANIFTLISGLFLLAGILFYIYWGIRYGVWADIGVYALTIFFVLAGVLGLLLTLLEQKEEQ